LREKGEVDEHKRVLGVVEDPGDLIRMQARIDRMADGADAGNGVEDFQMAVGAAGECRHPIARTHAESLQRASELPDPLGSRPVTAAMDRLLGRV
jgi:hypothetical protein